MEIKQNVVCNRLQPGIVVAEDLEGTCQGASRGWAEQIATLP
jgi:hypothetical protein